MVREVLSTNGRGRCLAGVGVTTYTLLCGVVATEVWPSLPWPLQCLIKHI